MKILMLSAFYPPTIGGIETHVSELSKALVRKGHKVTVLARYQLGKRPTKKIERKEGVLVKWLPAWFKGKDRITPNIATHPFNWLPTGQAWTSALIKIIHEDYDVIHAHSVVPIGTVASMAQRIMPRRFICTAHESMFLEGAHNPAYRTLAKASLGNAYAIIAVSEEIGSVARRIVPKGNVVEISNGVNPERFRPKNSDLLRREYSIPKDERIVLCARRLDDPKNGVIYLVKAIPLVVNKYPKVRFVFIGAGMSQHELDKALGPMKDHGIIAGPKPNKDMPKYYNSADLMVLPSLREATSIAGLEAMACGKPMVGTDVGGIPEIIIRGKNGYLCRPRDPKDLASTIIKTLRGDLGKMGKESRRLVTDRFTWSKVADKTIKAYGIKKTMGRKGQ